MNTIFGFGETMAGYEVPVLNEREVRAAAGILFLFALVSFLNSWLMGNFRLTQIFVIAFLIDFSIRIFINPKYSPSMILGRYAVRKQVPEWAGAPQKRFAWAVGWTLAVAMFYLIVLNNVVGPINLVVCAVFTPHASQKVGPVGLVIVVAFAALIGVIGQHWFPAIEAVATVAPVTSAPATDGKCTPPDWAVAMGHAEMWKLHNNCK